MDYAGPSRGDPSYDGATYDGAERSVAFNFGDGASEGKGADDDGPGGDDGAPGDGGVPSYSPYEPGEGDAPVIARPEGVAEMPPLTTYDGPVEFPLPEPLPSEDDDDDGDGDDGGG